MENGFRLNVNLYIVLPPVQPVHGVPWPPPHQGAEQPLQLQAQPHPGTFPSPTQDSLLHAAVHEENEEQHHSDKSYTPA